MSTRMQGVDYAWERPNHDALWNAGIRFVCRYLANDTTSSHGKILFKPELDALHHKGFGVVLNWEQNAGDMLKGQSLGVAHAEAALKQARALGAPDWIPIYFSCDVDTTNNIQRALVARYLDGCAVVLGRDRVGVYGEYEVVQAMVPEHASFGWQTYAWSHGLVTGDADFWQYRNGVTLAGVKLDLDEVLIPSRFGAWFPEDNMIVSDQDVTKIANGVWQHFLAQGNEGFAGQQAETALAMGWEQALRANENIIKLAQQLGTIPLVSGLSDADRAMIQTLTDAVNTLNSRLASP